MLIDNLVKDKNESTDNNEDNNKADYATRTELISFEQDMKQMLKSFLDFFMVYGMEFGESEQLLEIEKFTSKLHGLQKDLENDCSKSGGKATIKWKS